MNGEENSIYIMELIENYIGLENIIRKIINHYSNKYCENCFTTCCHVDICKETVDSKFLSLVIKRTHKNIKFHRTKGWASVNGCKLKNGRPLVCYDFFCNNIKIRCSEISIIKPYIKDFLSICNNAYGNSNLICIDNLNMISKNKLLKINTKISVLRSKTANHWVKLTTDQRPFKVHHISYH